MTFPTVQSVTPTAFGTAGTSHLVNMPATVNSGDLLLVLFGAVSFQPAAPTGWSKVGGQANGATLAGYVKAADGSEAGGTVDFSTGANSTKGAALCYRITGWINTGTILNDVEGSFQIGVTTANPDPPSFNPTNWDVEDTLWLAAAASNTSTTVTGAPANFSNLQSQASGGSGGASTKVTVGSAERDDTVASEDPGTFTFGASAATVVATMAIRPAGTATTTSPTTVEQPLVVGQSVRRAAFFFIPLLPEKA